jgi:SPP1 gp7 family putative phage head morphogenesis protein
MAQPQRRRRAALPTAEHWRKSDSIQEWYARQLRQVAREIGRIVDGFPLDDTANLPGLESALQRYSGILEPWANATAGRLFERVNDQDKRAWARTARMMSRALRKEIETAPTGATQAEFMRSQVHLIKSLPLQAGQKVHDLVLENQMQSGRAGELATKIREAFGDQLAVVTRNVEARATLIARTEVARAASSLTMVRAQHVGSEGYIWETARDADVRESHRKLQGKFFRWDSPPAHEEGGGKIYYSHAGAIFNCRCWPSPILQDI